MIRCHCAECGTPLTAADDQAGKQTQCPACQAPFWVPASQSWADVVGPQSSKSIWSALDPLAPAEGQRKPPRLDYNFAALLVVLLVLGGLVIVRLGPARPTDREVLDRLGQVQFRLDQINLPRDTEPQATLQKQIADARQQLKTQEAKLSDLGCRLGEQVAGVQAKLKAEKDDLEGQVAELKLRKSETESRLAYLQQSMIELENQVKEKPAPESKLEVSSPSRRTSGPPVIFIGKGVK